VVGNLQTTIQWAMSGLSYPGCWAYADMLEVGCQHGPHGAGDPGLSFVEARSHFAAWCIVSSPLILSHDVNNATVMQQIWPIISNTESLAVSQAWAGFSGSVFKQASVMTKFTDGTAVPAWQAWNKPVSKTAMAVLLMNHADGAASLTFNFADVPGLASAASYSVRDIHAHADLGTFTGSFTASNLPSHDSAFLMVTPKTL
jgi:alpha-galactosidase